ncbi:hypothetical protein FF38_11045 [Lucilia cuprina]|uniref:Secretory component protein SHR3 n=1 Tax=Lucilia cuprina TaxID=7375 RepID=A0A0L0CDE6_LUCCU|nr:hypothetical protein FF38_11045 [Lucilia cuprina]
MNYKALATGAMLVASGFILGAIYANWSYDYYLLWVSPTPADMLEKALEHYRLKATQPAILHHVLHAVFLFGGLSAVVKLFKPSESNTLFDGGSLFLFFICVVFYITNMIPASYSLNSGDWADIDSETGVKYIGASQILMVFTIIGVLALQFGQWWASNEDARLLAEFQSNQASEETEDLLPNTEAHHLGCHWDGKRIISASFPSTSLLGSASGVLRL